MMKAIIIGGGPAGLTAAYELQKHTDIQPIILEESEYWGGISRTINYKGNRIDIGGHRFFSKSDKVMEWWKTILPILSEKEEHTITYQNKSRKIRKGAILLLILIWMMSCLFVIENQGFILIYLVTNFN